MVYKLSIECANKDVAKIIQEWVFAHFNDDEVFWNGITEKKECNN